MVITEERELVNFLTKYRFVVSAQVTNFDITKHNISIDIKYLNRNLDVVDDRIDMNVELFMRYKDMIVTSICENRKFLEADEDARVEISDNLMNIMSELVASASVHALYDMKDYVLRSDDEYSTKRVRSLVENTLARLLADERTPDILEFAIDAVNSMRSD